LGRVTRVDAERHQDRIPQERDVGNQRQRRQQIQKEEKAKQEFRAAEQVEEELYCKIKEDDGVERAARIVRRGRK
jgi:hypothetical protein